MMNGLFVQGTQWTKVKKVVLGRCHSHWALYFRARVELLYWLMYYLLLPINSSFKHNCMGLDTEQDKSNTLIFLCSKLFNSPKSKFSSITLHKRLRIQYQEHSNLTRIQCKLISSGIYCFIQLYLLSLQLPLNS